MSFGSFRSIREIATTFQIALRLEPFLDPLPVAVDEWFVSDLSFTRSHVAVRVSEAAIGEFLVAPVLKQVWRPYSDVLTFWSHIPIGTEEPLVGFADYVFCRRSALGLVLDQPYVIVVEAKKDDFEGGWAQCLAAMLAAQRMNDDPAQKIFGVVSNGNSWQLGKLDQSVFTQELRDFVISDPAELLAALNAVFDQVREQLTAGAAS
jgi:hypothetical protein